MKDDCPSGVQPLGPEPLGFSSTPSTTDGVVERPAKGSSISDGVTVGEHCGDSDDWDVPF